MFQRKIKRFRSHRNGRGHQPHGNGHMQRRMRSDSFSNGPKRNNFRQSQSAEQLLEKYNTLANESLSSGDKTLAENYLQHADHFLRIVEEKNKNQTKIQVANKLTTSENQLVDNTLKSGEEKNKNQTKIQVPNKPTTNENKVVDNTLKSEEEK